MPFRRESWERSTLRKCATVCFKELLSHSYEENIHSGRYSRGKDGKSPYMEGHESALPQKDLDAPPFGPACIVAAVPRCHKCSGHMEDHMAYASQPAGAGWKQHFLAIFRPPNSVLLSQGRTGEAGRHIGSIFNSFSRCGAGHRAQGQPEANLSQ